MFYNSMWAGGFGRHLDPGVMWSAYNKLFPVDVEHMPEDADSEQHVGMRPSLSPPPLNAPIPSKRPLLPSEESRTEDATPLTNGSSAEDRPPLRINGLNHSKSPEEDRIQEYLQRSDTAVIFPEPVGGKSPKEEKGRLTPDPTTESKVSRDSPLKCPHCDQVFPGGQQALPELKEHLSHSHKEESSFTCQKCNSFFTSKECLAKHKLLHVTNGQSKTTKDGEKDRKFKCTDCGKAFGYKHHLKEHIRIHSGEKPFACPNCGKRFSHSGSYSSHMTSKKCLVVNLKVRKVDSRSPRGRGSTQNNSFRPIIPKYHATVRKYGSSGADGGAPTSSDMPLIPAGFMPSPERFSSFSSRPQQPFLPLTFHPLLASQPHYPHLPLGPFPEVTHLLQQRRYESDSDNPAHPQLPPHMVPSSSNLHDKADDSPPASPKPVGELNAVKKILEIVDATVTKQQKSPTRPQRNGLLSELLSAAPHPIMKSPPPFGASLDARCRFCSRFFESKVDLYQHERYLCHHNSELRAKSESSPQEMGSDGESCEENTRVSGSPSALSVDCVFTLKAHHQINPRPKKSELIRLSRDLKCSARIVQEWFHSKQQARSKDYPMNGHHSHSPTPPNHSGHSFPSAAALSCNGHPFQSAVVPHHNGAISSCTQITPFRPIAERSPRLDVVESTQEEQPLDLSIKMRRDDQRHENSLRDNPDRELHSPPNHCDNGEVLNLSQRSSRTPPKVSSPYSLNGSRSALLQQQQAHNHNEDSASQNSNLHSSVLYKYMQMGISNHRLSPQREKSPLIEMPPSPDRSPSHVERSRAMSSPGGVSYTDHSSSPSGTTGSYCHTDEPGDGIPYSPSPKKARLWNQEEADENTLEDCPGAEEDSSGGSSKMRKSWKLHKVESEVGMYACDQCDKMFSKQSSLARHKYEHSGQRPHKCDVCSKAFKHKHHLTEHKRLHSGEKPFQCKKCLKRFSHSGSYSQHMNHRFNYCKPYHD